MSGLQQEVVHNCYCLGFPEKEFSDPFNVDAQRDCPLSLSR